MDTTIEGNVAFLEEAKQALAQLETIRTQKLSLSTNEKRIEKLISAEERTTADEIARTTKKRREEVGTGYDKQIANVQERLKKLKVKKEHARNASMNVRIQEETAELNEQITTLRNHYKTLLKQARAPKYCYRGWFYLFFMTSTIWQWLVVLLSVIVWMFALPYAIYMFGDMERPIILSLLHLVFFAATMVVYFYINAKGKYRYYDTLRAVQNDRDQIRYNKKKIKVVISAIRKDRDEERYDLSEYNYEIAKMEAEIEDIVSKKNDALATFDAVTKRVISDELTETSRVRIHELKAELAANSSALTQTEERFRDCSLRVTDQYGGYLPKEYMTGTHIDQLIHILKSGEAASISEAVSVYQTKRA